MSEQTKSNIIWAVTAIVIVAIFVYGIITTNQQNRDLEDKMRASGYEQGSIPGQVGSYWVKP